MWHQAHTNSPIFLKHARRHMHDHARSYTRLCKTMSALHCGSYRTYSNLVMLVSTNSICITGLSTKTPPWTIPFISTRKHLGRVQLLTDLKSVFSTDLRAVRKLNWSQMRRATVEDAAGSAACRLDFTGVGRNVGNSRSNTSMLKTKWMLPNLTIRKSQIFSVTTNIYNLFTWTKESPH